MIHFARDVNRERRREKAGEINEVTLLHSNVYVKKWKA